jgi:type IV secretion system protein VirD4
MSSRFINREWGPSHQEMASPFRTRRSRFWKFVGWYVLALTAHGVVDPGGQDALGWSLKTLVVGWLAVRFVRAVRDGRIPVAWLWKRVSTEAPDALPALIDGEPVSTGGAVRAKIARLGGGAYLGVSLSGEWLTANPRHQVGVIGAPQSGKSTGFLIPGVGGSSGAVISVSTKPDVMEATVVARSEIGQAWLFDPAGKEKVLPAGVRRLNWSPVAAAVTWDDALLMAGAMTAAARPGTGITDASHWTERAEALLAPLLYAANQAGLSIGDVLEWILHKDLEPALQVLRDCDAKMAVAVLAGIDGTDSREKSSIFSATAGVLAAYRSDGVRASAAEPNFDPVRFARSNDTIYVTSPEQYQRLAAPLIVGLLEEVRQAVYMLVASGEMPAVMKWFVDEFTNIAPIIDPLALLSQAGGQMLHVVLGFQDLGQIRDRYGEAVADAFLTLLQTIVLLPGIRDSRTLEGISLALGEYDRDMVNHSLGRSDPQEWLGSPTHSDTVSYQSQRQRVLTPGDIAGLPKGHALVLQGMDWQLVTVTRWFETEPWRTVAGEAARKRSSVPGLGIQRRNPGRAAMRGRSEWRRPPSARGIRSVRAGSPDGRSWHQQDARVRRAV